MRARCFERQRASGDGRSGGKDIINEQDALAFDQARMANRKSFLNAFTSRARIHSGAVARCVCSPSETPFVNRQAR